VRSLEIAKKETRNVYGLVPDVWLNCQFMKVVSSSRPFNMPDVKYMLSAYLTMIP